MSREGDHRGAPSGRHSYAPEARDVWLRRVGIQPIRIFPGSLWENGYDERFNGSLRREVLNAEWFTTTKQAQIVTNHWLKQYNHTRPHQALNMRPPVPETLLEKAQVSGPKNRELDTGAMVSGTQKFPFAASARISVSIVGQKPICVVARSLSVDASVTSIGPCPHRRACSSSDNTFVQSHRSEGSHPDAVFLASSEPQPAVNS